MRITVTGGTGFIGSALVPALAARGDDVKVLARDVQKADALAATNVSVVPWPQGPEGWQQAIEGADAIIHLAGENVATRPWTEARKKALRASRVEPTSAIAQAITHATHKPKTWISASAVGIYGSRHDDEVLTETNGLGNDFLAELCAEWEGLADAVSPLGVRVVHPRTGIVLGEGGGALHSMRRPFRWFLGGPVGDGKQWISWIHRCDVVRALIFALETDGLNGPFNLVAPNSVTMNEFADVLGAAMKRPSALRVPAFAIKALLGQEMAEVLLGGQRAKPSRLEEHGFAFEFPLLAEALRHIIRVTTL